jgi:stearoyl-CoA desaturase (delta-9 desaturase)
LKATARPSGRRTRGPSRQHPRAGDDRLCWSTIAGLLLIHVAGAAGVVWIVLNPSLPTLALTGAFYVACGLSVTAGNHRLFAHRTYRPTAAVRWALLAFGAATFQNSALS